MKKERIYLDTSVPSAYYDERTRDWNFEHLVKIRKKRLINSVNILQGFGEIDIISPQEL